jgi:hypothetical protein
MFLFGLNCMGECLSRCCYFLHLVMEATVCTDIREIVRFRRYSVMLV